MQLGLVGPLQRGLSGSHVTIPCCHYGVTGFLDECEQEMHFNRGFSGTNIVEANERKPQHSQKDSSHDKVQPRPA